jgi:hypothetical protein
MWLTVVIGVVIGWTVDHRRLVWRPSDDDLWIPLAEFAERGTIDEMSRMLDDAKIPHAVRPNQLGGFRILVTLPNLDAALAAIDGHPSLPPFR